MQQYERDWYTRQQQTARQIRQELQDDRAITVEGGPAATTPLDGALKK